MRSFDKEELQQKNITRRFALKAIACTVFPLPAFSAERETKSLSLYRPSTGESVKTVYWQNGSIYLPGYIAVCSLLRDVRQDSSVQMALPLLDVISWMQAYFSIYGWRQHFLVHSGYRTIQSNQSTEGAAKNSLHQLGMAADISIPGVPTEYLGEFLKRLGQGGVGVYQSRNTNRGGFVHIDVGRIRTWRG